MFGRTSRTAGTSRTGKPGQPGGRPLRHRRRRISESWRSSRRSLAAGAGRSTWRTIPGDAGRSVLARALTALAGCLADADRHAEAVTAATEALGLYRGLEPGSPERQGETAARDLVARSAERNSG